MTTIGSLFSGIGGIERGLESVIPDARVIWQAESDPAARRVLAKHWPTVHRYNDVKEIDHEAPPADIICGGFPCQDISVAGAGRGIDGERSGLWREFARIIRALSPALVFIENVPALASRGLDEVLRDLAEVRLDAEWTTVRALDVGAPHRRERLFVLAYADGERLRQLAERLQWDRRGVRETEREYGEPVDDREALADAAGSRRGNAEDAGTDCSDEGAEQSDGRRPAGLSQSQRGGSELADAALDGRGSGWARGSDPGGAREPQSSFLADAAQLGRDERSGDPRDGATPARGQRRGIAESGRRSSEARGVGLADTNSGDERYEHRFPPGPAGIAEWAGAQPAVRRGDAGIPAGMDRGWRAKNRIADRLRLLGNTCIPQQAALAFVTLAARAAAATRERAA